MKPLESLKPQLKSQPKTWWPSTFGHPSTSGSTDNLRYAYFPQARRLVIEQSGAMTAYDTGEYQFRGLLQTRGPDNALSFMSQRGRIDVGQLAKLD